MLRAIDDESLEEMTPADALTQAAQNRIRLTVGQFLWTRRESRSKTAAFVASFVGVPEATYLTWEHDTALVPEEFKPKLKSVLDCRGGQYEGLFDNIIGTGVVAVAAKPAPHRELAAPSQVKSVPLRVSPAPALVQAVPPIVLQSQPDLVKEPVIAPAVTHLVRSAGEGWSSSESLLAPPCMRKIYIPDVGTIEVALDNDRHNSQSDASIVLALALDGKVTLQPHVFLNYRHDVQPNVSIKTIAQATGCSAQEVKDIFDGSKPIPPQSIRAFKRVLNCEGRRYSPYFDKLFAPLVASVTVPDDAIASRLMSDRQSLSDALAVFHHMPQGQVSREVTERLKARTPKELAELAKKGERYDDETLKTSGEAWMREARKKQTGEAACLPTTQIAPHDNSHGKMIAPRDIHNIDYVDLTKEMDGALWDGKKDIWNAGIKKLLAENPCSMIDLRDQDFVGGNKNYRGFDFSNCDMRGADFPTGDRFRDVVMKGALLVDGAHDKTNSAYKDLPRNVQQSYEANNQRTL